MMNRRDNYLAFLNHQSHDHLPLSSDSCGTGGAREYFENGPTGGGLDGFGLEWMTSASAMNQGLPAPGKYVITDITEWKKQVKFPDIANYDWQGMADEQLARFDPANQIQEYGMWNGQFERITHLMGFENGLMALALEPEACTEFLTAVTDYRISTLEYIKKYFNPDSVCLYDDFATEIGLFLSPDTYFELIAPQHKRLFDAIKSYGMIPNLHICGKPEEVIPRIPEEGCAAWEICQPENDLLRLQKEVGDKLAFIGCYDMLGKLTGFNVNEPTEAELRKSVHDVVDLLGPGGNVSIMAVIWYSDMAKFGRTAAILGDELAKLSTNYYC